MNKENKIPDLKIDKSVFEESLSNNLPGIFSRINTYNRLSVWEKIRLRLKKEQISIDEITGNGIVFKVMGGKLYVIRDFKKS